MAEPIVVAQVSDLHVGIFAADPEREARHREQLARGLAQVAATVPEPALVLATGDLVDHGAEEEVAVLLGLLEAVPSPLVLLPGNHDDREVLARAVGKEAPPAPGLSPFDVAVDLGPLRVVGLDSLDPGKPSGRLLPAQLDWLDAQLGVDDRPTIVAVHHPPVPIGHAAMDGMALVEPERLAAVLARHPHVALVVCGHVHRTTFGRLGAVPVVTAPSLAYQLAPDLDGTLGFDDTSEPAAYALHRWHPAQGLTTHVVGVT